MKTEDPHFDDDATAQPSLRAVMVLIAIIAIAAGWTTGFFCGAILTRPNRQKVAAEIATIQDAAATDRLAAAAARRATEELRTQYAALQKTGGELIFDNAMLSVQLDMRTEQIAALTAPPPGGLAHIEEKSDSPPRFTSSGVRIVESYAPDTCRIVGQVKSTLAKYRRDCYFTISVFDRQKRLLDVGSFFVTTLTTEILKSFDVTVQAPSADIYYYQITMTGRS